MVDFEELEYKYKADNIKLAEFVKLMNSLDVVRRLDISSWDHYYTTKELDSFQRFRQSDTPELTKKIKTKEGNNWKRVEVDLPLDFSRVTEATVRKYVELDGYGHNFTIYKTCFIFWLDNVNYVYYIVYDENMTEKGRFVEVEVNKDKVRKLNMEISGGGAEQYLNEQEKLLSKIGISPQNRMKKSLFELFVRS